VLIGINTKLFIRKLMSSTCADERKYVEELRKLREEKVRLLSNKKWCEKTLCGEFLSRVGLDFNEREIIEVFEKDEPPDIKFKSSNFEVMYIVGNRKIDKETKDSLKQAKEAKSIDDTLFVYEPLERITFTYLNKIIAQGLTKKRNHYDPNTLSTLDALVYVRLRQFPDINSDFPDDLSELTSQGWRSVSVVINEYALVIYANSSAPDFLRNIEKKLIRKQSMSWWYPKTIP